MSSSTSPETKDLIGGSPSDELSSNRTSLSFERTLMSADRTLMSVLRTSLSLIGFGFTIYEAFHQAHKSGIGAVGEHSARNFGLALEVLGVGLLASGIISHAMFQRELSRRRDRLYGLSLLHNVVRYRATPTFVVAILLLLVGIAAIASMVWRAV